MLFRLPSGLWSWRATVLVCAVLVLPTAALLALVHPAGFVESLGPARTLLFAWASLASAVVFCAHGRLADNDHSLWLGAALGIFAFAGLARGSFALTHPEIVHLRAPSLLAAMIVTALLVVVVIAAGSRKAPIAGPLRIGIALSVLVMAGQGFVLSRGPVLDRELLPALRLTLVLAVVALVATVRLLDALPDWVRLRTGVAVALGSISVVVLAAAPIDELARGLLGLALTFVGAVVLATTAGALLREVLHDGLHQLTDLQSRLAAAEAGQRADHARLHDIHTLVAGVASASRLIHDLPPSEHRAGLEAMVLAELERLQRLLGEGETLTESARSEELVVDEVDVDEVVGRIALAHGARGHVVVSHATGAHIRGNADDLAQLLDILVENAAQHGSPDRITVSVRRTSSWVEIAVSDRGPGVPIELRDRLFDWGARGPRSRGNGIGLHTATALADQLGGELRLDRSTRGARFVVSLPGLPEELVTEELVVAAS